jgi:hypothetical protein
MQPRSSRIEVGGTSWLAKMLARVSMRRRVPSTEKLSDHLLRDAGLERIGGRMHRRLR